MALYLGTILCRMGEAKHKMDPYNRKYIKIGSLVHKKDSYSIGGLFYIQYIGTNPKFFRHTCLNASFGSQQVDTLLSMILVTRSRSTWYLSAFTSVQTQKQLLQSI